MLKQRFIFVDLCIVPTSKRATRAYVNGKESLKYSVCLVHLFSGEKLFNICVRRLSGEPVFEIILISNQFSKKKMSSKVYLLKVMVPTLFSGVKQCLPL